MTIEPTPTETPVETLPHPLMSGEQPNQDFAEDPIEEEDPIIEEEDPIVEEDPIIEEEDPIVEEDPIKEEDQIEGGE